MIINTIDKNKIKILFNRIDLDKAKISPEKFISNSNKTLEYIKDLLKLKLDFKDYFIYTYNYNTFLVVIYL